LPRERLQLAAATSRLVLGLFAMVVLPLLYPGLAQHRVVFAVYLAVAVVMQLLIWRGVGGNLRAIAGGVVDMVALTFIVHRVGSFATMMVSLYFFAAIVNTLVAGRRVGLTLAICSAFLYAGVLWAEVLGVLPYGPDAPSWGRGITPGPVEATVACGLMVFLLIASAWTVGVLVQRLESREEELVRANKRLEELSARDPLTQLFNRRHLMSRVEAELARVRRGHPLAVVMIDLDRFKHVNDERGHEKGDEVLKDIATALAAEVRAIDVPGRYGGDEFIVLLPDTDIAHANVVAERLVSAVRAVGERHDPEKPVTASAGVATAHADDGGRALIRRADERAYAAKQAGGDRVWSGELPSG
jgi:diguanylate cyclase (GGDEF)-like protein